MADRLYKNVAVARSGVYQYHRSEIQPMMGMTIPEGKQDQEWFNVYRPALVIEQAAQLYARQPVVLNHPGEVTPENWKDLTLGLTGDTCSVEYLESNEVRVRTTLTLGSEEGIEAYEAGTREVSPGYEATFSWQEGSSPNGEKFDILMTGIKSVNHLALCPQGGRGGKSAAILDHKGGSGMKLKTGLFHTVAKLLVGDKKPASFRDALTKLVQDRSSLEDGAFNGRMDEIAKLAGRLPDTDGKKKLDLYLSDIRSMVKDSSDDEATKAAGIVADLYDSLDKDAEEDTKLTKDTDAESDLAHAGEAGSVASKGAQGVAAGVGQSAQAASNTKEVPVEKPAPAPKPAAGEANAGAAPATKDALDTLDPDPTNWSDDEIHALFAFVHSAIPALKKLLGEEAAEPGHEAIQPDLEAASEALPGETAEPAPEAAPEAPAEEDPDRKTVGDAAPLFNTKHAAPAAAEEGAFASFMTKTFTGGK